MEDHYTQNLFDALLNGFEPGSTTFINWELVTKKGNISIRDSERKNMFDRIADTHRKGMEFIVIIDEEHSNNTAKALYVNEGVADGAEITDDYDYLLDLADGKRKEIVVRYQQVGKNIRPLVLIQFPNGQPETIVDVEQKLKSMGYTYDNGMVSKWMSESFEIQTIGRIRRMPEAKHYEDDLLDFCYVYTFDEKYKAGLLSNIDKAYETRRLFLKDKCKTFTLEKEIRDLDFNGLAEREVLNKVHSALVKKYKLSGTKEKNRLLFETAEFYAFVINNEHLLKEDFREVTADMTVQMSMLMHPKKSQFHWICYQSC